MLFGSEFLAYTAAAWTQVLWYWAIPIYSQKCGLTTRKQKCPPRLCAFGHNSSSYSPGQTHHRKAFACDCFKDKFWLVGWLFFFLRQLCVALAILELTLQTSLALNSEIHLPLPPKYRDQRHAPLCLAHKKQVLISAIKNKITKPIVCIPGRANPCLSWTPSVSPKESGFVGFFVILGTLPGTCTWRDSASPSDSQAFSKQKDTL